MAQEADKDRLETVGDEMLAVLEAHSDGDLKAILMLKDGKTGGVKAAGYGDASDVELLADLLGHIQALLGDSAVITVRSPEHPGK